MISTVEKIYFESEFDNYKMTLSDNSIWYVPVDEENSDYQAIQEWSAIDGNNIIDNGGGE